MRKTNNYPFVLVHGYLCWGNDDRINDICPLFGMWNGSAKTALLDAGYIVDTPSVGMFSGMWDRACELYAFIKGGRVDYGKVHSERNGHARFGKTYPGYVPNWGELDENGKIQKINLIGHSFGGPTVRTLIHLLAEGSEIERQGTDPDDLSDLFKGGKVKWVHSCTTLAGTHNGVTLPEQIQPVIKPLAFTIFSLAPLTSGTWFSKVYGFHLDRFGLSSQTKHVGWDPTLLLHYVNLREDNIHWELSREGAKELTKDYTVYDNIYYFSYYGTRTAENRAMQVRRRMDAERRPRQHPRRASSVQGPVAGLRPRQHQTGHLERHAAGVQRPYVLHGRPRGQRGLCPVLPGHCRPCHRPSGHRVSFSRIVKGTGVSRSLFV